MRAVRSANIACSAAGGAPTGTLMRQLIVVGAPMSGSFLLEYGVFAAAAQLMGWIGTAALAAHQIALQIAAVMFMVPFGIAHGGDRARRPRGRTRRCGGDAARRLCGDRARRGFHGGDDAAGRAHARTRCRCCSSARDAPDPQTVALAASLLVLGATFFIADGVQTIAAGALRGLNDTRVPLLFAAISFWLIGFTGCWLFGFTLGLGAYGIWIGLSLGIAVYAVLLIWRFQLLTARHYLPADRERARCMTERLTIARLGHRGDGIADTAAGPVFVPYTLPGEMVEVEPFPGHPDRRHLLRVETPSAERIAPICPHFGVCGGCQTQHWDFARYRDWKREPGRRGTAAGRPRRAGRRPDRRARRGPAARGLPRAAQRSMTCSRSALRPSAAHHIVSIDRCPVLAPALDGAIPAAWALAEALGAMKKPLDIQVTATDAGLDVDVRGSGPLPPQRADARWRGSPRRIGSRGSRATAS